MIQRFDVTPAVVSFNNATEYPPNFAALIKIIDSGNRRFHLYVRSAEPLPAAVGGVYLDPRDDADYTYYYPLDGASADDTPVESVSITSANVNGSTITVVASKANTTKAIEYSINGTTWQETGVFENVPNGTYSATARLVGTSITDVEGGIVVNVVVPNNSPVANAGSDNSITLPTSSVVLLGSGSDSDGTIASYLWEQIIGPNTASISDTSAAQPTVTNLIEGTYQFRLTVTDDDGATHQDTVQLIVNPVPSTGYPSTYTL